GRRAGIRKGERLARLGGGARALPRRGAQLSFLGKIFSLRLCQEGIQDDDRRAQM
ncbi:unnamed protein product, partial [Rangifer tarandus platyrhynchus]